MKKRWKVKLIENYYLLNLLTNSLSLSLCSPVSQRSPHGHAVYTTALSEIFAYLNIMTSKYQKWIRAIHASQILLTYQSTA